MELSNTFNAAAQGANGGETIASGSAEGMGASTLASAETSADGLSAEFNEAAGNNPPPPDVGAVPAEENGEGLDDDPEPTRPAPAAAQPIPAEETEETESPTQTISPPEPKPDDELTAEELQALIEQLEDEREEPQAVYEHHPEGSVVKFVHSAVSRERENRIVRLKGLQETMSQREGVEDELDNGEDDGLSL